MRTTLKWRYLLGIGGGIWMVAVVILYRVWPSPLLFTAATRWNYFGFRIGEALAPIFFDRRNCTKLCGSRVCGGSSSPVSNYPVFLGWDFDGLSCWIPLEERQNHPNSPRVSQQLSGTKPTQILLNAFKISFFS